MIKALYIPTDYGVLDDEEGGGIDLSSLTAMNGPTFQNYIKTGGFSYTNNRVTATSVFPIAVPVFVDGVWKVQDWIPRTGYFSLTTYAASIFASSYGLSASAGTSAVLPLPIEYDSYDDDGTVKRFYIYDAAFVEGEDSVFELPRLPITISEVPNAVMLDATLTLGHATNNSYMQYKLSGTTIYVEK